MGLLLNVSLASQAMSRSTVSVSHGQPARRSPPSSRPDYGSGTAVPVLSPAARRPAVRQPAAASPQPRSPGRRSGPGSPGCRVCGATAMVSAEPRQTHSRDCAPPAETGEGTPVSVFVCVWGGGFPTATLHRGDWRAGQGQAAQRQRGLDIVFIKLHFVYTKATV